MELENLRYLVVGSGFFGATIAERIAEDKKERVAVIERRGHIGGNCFSELDRETGIECHTYGSHIFHTKDEKVWKYINRFTSFNRYIHKVLVMRSGRVYQLPINLSTINAIYNTNLTPSEAEDFIRSEILKEGLSNPSNFEEQAISKIGRRLYEAFIRDYTIKQWGTDPRELPVDIVKRILINYNYDGNYFDDPWQGLPLDGYFMIFERMLKHKNITVYLNTDYFDVKESVHPGCLIIYTGPVDRFFDYKFGKLLWRTLYFEKEVHNIADFQGTSVMNYADLAVHYTRIHEFKHFHRERHYPSDRTVIFREFSQSVDLHDEPFYPVNSRKDKEIMNLYFQECGKRENVLFGGRLGAYRYINMDQAIAEALMLYETHIKNRHTPS